MEINAGVIEETTEESQWHRADWMQTYTGKKFYPTAPIVEDIDIEDIAHSLSMQCRYNGHVREFYSVAEHCILMSYAVPAEFALEALLHDATEAYVGDMVRPLKIQMPEFQEAERVIAEAIAARFGTPSSSAMSPEVKDADNRILLDEKAALMGRAPGAWAVDGLEPLRVYIKKWQPREARYKYILRFAELTGQDIVTNVGHGYVLGSL